MKENKEGKGQRSQGRRSVIFNRVVRDGLSKEVTLEYRDLKEVREQREKKGCLVGSRNSWEDNRARKVVNKGEGGKR